MVEMHKKRCYHVWSWVPKSEYIVDTLAWFPTNLVIPDISDTSQAIVIACNLMIPLYNPSLVSPLSPIVNNEMRSLKQLVVILPTKRNQLLLYKASHRPLYTYRTNITLI